jgi:hypothetical protein
MADAEQRIRRYIDWLTEDAGFQAVQPLPGGLYWVGIRKKMFTWSIEKGRLFDYIGTDDCWCYPNYAEAIIRLMQWLGEGGKGEPEGWIRHPGTGRRVAGPEGAIDGKGRLVEPGHQYVRR